jgi:hypothetical protein
MKYFITLFLLSSLSLHAESKSIDFSWQLVAQNSDGSERPIHSRRRVKLKGGDGIRFIFENIDKERVFLYHQGQEGTLSIFEPTPDQKGKASFPPEGQWIFLGHQPSEEVFSLVSILPKDKELLTLHEAFRSKPDPQHAKAIFDLLKARKEKGDTLASDGEKPLAIAGSLRSITANEKNKLPLRKVEKDAFFTQTLKVSH